MIGPDQSKCKNMVHVVDPYWLIQHVQVFLIGLNDGPILWLDKIKDFKAMILANPTIQPPEK